MIRKKLVESILNIDQRTAVKIVSGNRSYGKTFLLMNLSEYLIANDIYPSDIIYLSLPDEEIYDTYKLYEYISNKIIYSNTPNNMKYILVDNINIIHGWEQVASSVMSDYNVDVYVSVSTRYTPDPLDRRSYCIKLYPLTMSEFGEIRSEMQHNYDDKFTMFNDYINCGGSPLHASIMIDQNDVDSVLRDYFYASLMEDVIIPDLIRDPDLLLQIVRFIAAHTGEIFSPKMVSDAIKPTRNRLSADTVYSYIESLIKAGIVIPIPRVRIKTNVVIKSVQKLYLHDTFVPRIFSENKITNGIYQNAIILHLLRNGYSLKIVDEYKRSTFIIASRRGINEYIFFNGRDDVNEVIDDILNKYDAVQNINNIYISEQDKYNNLSYKVSNTHIIEFLMHYDPNL